MTTKFLKINPDDNVAVAISNLSKGEQLNVEGTEVTLLEDVPAGHKFTLKDIKEGENVIKYGFPIGHAKRDIQIGEKVSPENLKSNLAGIIDWSYTPYDEPESKKSEAFFMGYQRASGDVGIRNDIWIIPTVGCANAAAKKLAELTGAKAYTHPYGCSQLGIDLENTKKTLKFLNKVKRKFPLTTVNDVTLNYTLFSFHGDKSISFLDMLKSQNLYKVKRQNYQYYVFLSSKKNEIQVINYFKNLNFVPISLETKTLFLYNNNVIINLDKIKRKMKSPGVASQPL